MKKLLCATLVDIKAKEVEVEVNFVRALPSFSIVGLAQTSIQESKERIKSALSSIEFKFPPQKLVVNLSPSDLKKTGTHFDLPVALLIALYKSNIMLENLVAFGELGLDGKLKDTNSIFPIILSLSPNLKNKKVLIPKDSYETVSKIPNLNLIVADNLEEMIKNLTNNKTPIKTTSSLEYKTIKLDKQYYYHDRFEDDFSEIKGQARAIRASLIASAGFHNILYEGSPGCGKSMCAKRLQHILPPMSLDEILDKARLDALSSKEIGFVPKRSFRSPHNSASRASIFGGRGSIGEVGLAHNGILFLDEFPHFEKIVLENLREPLQDYKILISRVDAKTEYPTKFMLVGAQNPCPCGNLFSKQKECRCTELEIKRYKNRLSSPILDRIELYVQMEEVNYDDKPLTNSKGMYQKVLDAFRMQKTRKQTEFNGKLNDKEIAKFCVLDEDAIIILNTAIQRYELSQRTINNIKKVARTIADLEGSQQIKKPHLLEALSFRMQK